MVGHPQEEPSIARRSLDLAAGRRLTPCPFCGSAAMGLYEHHYSQTFAIVCKACGAEGPTRHSPDEAMRLWNQRVRG